MPEEANKLLHAWAKQHKEDNDLTNGDMSLMLFKWTTELAFIRAKLLAKCILERAAFSAPQQRDVGAGRRAGALLVVVQPTG